MKKNYIILIVLQALFFAACSDIQYIELEKDGNVTYAYENDINQANQYFLEFDTNDLKEIAQYDYSNVNIDRDIYNFYVVVPVKSKKDIFNTFSADHPDAYGVNMKRACENSDACHINVRGSIGDYGVRLENDGYYHYKIYYYAQYLAHNYYLNDIVDKVIYMDYFYSDGIKRTEYSTNKLTIPAKEFEEMLDGLGIPHERLEFQPDGY